VRHKFSSTFALFRDNIQFQFLQRSNVNRRTAVCKLLLLSRNTVLDVVSKLPARRLPCLTGLRFFFSLERPDRLWGPSSLLFSEYPGSVLGGKAAGEFAVDDSSPSTAEVKNKGIYNPSPPIFLNFVDRNKFEFALLLRLGCRVNLHVFCNILINL
jgi:hypothetical protein